MAWYSNKDTFNRILQMKVHWVVKALKGEDTAVLPPAAKPAVTAVTALLALAGGGGG